MLCLVGPECLCQDFSPVVRIAAADLPDPVLDGAVESFDSTVSFGVIRGRCGVEDSVRVAELLYLRCVHIGPLIVVQLFWGSVPEEQQLVLQYTGQLRPARVHGCFCFHPFCKEVQHGYNLPFFNVLLGVQEISGPEEAFADGVMRSCGIVVSVRVVHEC